MDWAEYLDAGEVLEWEGRPAPRCFTFRNWRHSLFGLLLLLIAVYWQVVGFQMGLVYQHPYFAWVPLPVIFVALYLTLGHLIHARLEWEKVFYAISDRRLLVVRGVWRPRLRAVPLEAVRWFQLKPLGADLATLKIRTAEPVVTLFLSCVEHPRPVVELLEARMRDCCLSEDVES
ncbi:MAG TPA: PH domain-containing protein [Desulfuromonadales bacterium]|nr:PH domain-containing protein [Desulfuromonadales bacterium]